MFQALNQIIAIVGWWLGDVLVGGWGWVFDGILDSNICLINGHI